MIFFKVYGRDSIILLVFLVLFSGAFLFFFRQWKSFGIPEGGKGVSLSGKVQEKQKPVLVALSRRFIQGEKVTAKKLASAWEESGRDLSEYIHIYDSTGKEVTGLFDTGKPGKYELEIVVESPASGLKSRKKITVLVDGRVKSS